MRAPSPCDHNHDVFRRFDRGEEELPEVVLYQQVRKPLPDTSGALLRENREGDVGLLAEKVFGVFL